MKASDELILVPDEEGFRPWRMRGGVSVLESTTRSRRTGADWIAIPAKQLVHVPIRFQGVEGNRKEAAALLELEAAGVGGESLPAHDFELREAEEKERDTRATICLQTGTLPAGVLADADHARFAPSYDFRKLNPGEVQLWKEGESWVLAIPDETGRVLHCQALTFRDLDSDAAAEIRCLLASLDLAGLAAPWESLAISAQQPEQVLVTQGFRDGLDITVSVQENQPPVRPERSSRLIPGSVVQTRQQRSQQRMFMLGAVALLLLLVAGLGAFAGRLLMREYDLSEEEARLAELAPMLGEIEAARIHWEALGQALVPADYPVEIFHQLVLLLPPEGIRLTRLEIKTDMIVLDGEASSLTHGIQFRQALVSSPAFADWGFSQGFSQPVSLPDGRATFHAEGRRGALVAGMEGSLPPP